ncbi:MAG TPA: copper-binding protein [Bryobacteraceae bacterium]|jgi:Cu/Ag efflux protein CusF|nr:copper-binding protein [Bryobacteraceae bacterium]
MMKTAWLLVLLIALMGCGSKEPVKRYPMQGDVKAVDPMGKTATIAAGKLGDWMEAMTMEYPIKPASDLDKLHVGDHVEGTVVVDGGFFYLTEVKVVPPK